MTDEALNQLKLAHAQAFADAWVAHVERPIPNSLARVTDARRALIRLYYPNWVDPMERRAARLRNPRQAVNPSAGGRE